MNVGAWLVWGFAATLVLTMLMAGSQALHLTRMSIPYMLGSMFTRQRGRAQVLGILLHQMNGWVFSLIYVAAFHVSGWFTVWFGCLVGLVHGAFVLTVAMPVLPALHPRMASETQGPTLTRQLEPPGFLGLHYGGRTPLSVLVAHVIFGAILGLFYRP
jgi:hypothetical protein